MIYEHVTLEVRCHHIEETTYLYFCDESKDGASTKRHQPFSIRLYAIEKIGAMDLVIQMFRDIEPERKA